MELPSINPRGYAYSPLQTSSSQIRLLHIQPGQQDDPLHCTLQHVSLADRHDYETISYVWGDASLLSSLTIQEQAILVPVSSADVCRRVRSERDVRVIWIDAICIDQTNIEERSQQVALIRAIYSRATVNLIYLGNSDTAHLEITAVQEVFRELRDDTNDLTALSSTLGEKGSGWLYSKSGFRSKVNLDLLEKIYSSPWFRCVTT